MAPAQGDVPLARRYALRATSLLLRRGRPAPPPRLPDVIGWGPVAHYTSEHREFDGIMVPTRRRVDPVDPGGNVADEPLVVAIDLDSVKFS